MPPTLTPAMLQEISQRSGFILSGVTGTAPLADFERYKQWINAGYHASMHYLEASPGREIRANPALFLPQARSILICASRYAVPPSPVQGDDLSGRVSAYALGGDYHTVLRQRAENLVTELTRLSGLSLQTRIAIDSAPVLEKPLAQRAGLGWQGKNSCLIHPRQGSFFFLVNIFTSLELEDTGPITADHCGACRRCLDACPTGCILPDRTIDARRCISYQTIENKGAIPPDIRPQLGHWLFGCDVCQMVCPWNRKADNAPVADEFLPQSETAAFPDLRQIVRLTEPEFKSRFRDSPILRAKRRGLLRNAAVVLGNFRSPEALPPLVYLLENDPDPLIRAHAAWGLGRTPASQARVTLSERLKTESDMDVHQEIIQALDQN